MKTVVYTLPLGWAELLVNYNPNQLESSEIDEINLWLKEQKKEFGYSTMIAYDAKESKKEASRDVVFYTEDGTETISASFVREDTLIFDEPSVAGICVRFNEYCMKQKLQRNKEAWGLFRKPVEYTDFMSLMGQKIKHEGEVVTLEKPYYLASYNEQVDEMFGPPTALAQGKARIGLYSPAAYITYPVDSDLKIAISLVGEKAHNHVMMSYNQLAGLCSEGRDFNWTEDTDYTSSTVLRDEFTKDWISEPLYRKTPSGEPQVDELIKPGAIIRSNYSKQEYIVTKVVKHIYKPDERPSDHVFPVYSLSLIDRNTKKGGYCINEIVATHGRLLKLFAANDDEVFVLGHIDEVPEAVKDDEEEQCDSCELEYSNEVVTAVHKETPAKKGPVTVKGHVQPSLF